MSASEDLRPSWRQLWRAKHSLRVVESNLKTFPEDSRSRADIGVAEYNFCSRSRKFGRVGFRHLLDGVAVTYTKEGALAYSSHRFIFPDGQEPLYHREYFDLDPQCIGGPALNLAGVKQIAAHEQASSELAFVASEIQELGYTGWPLSVTVNVPGSSC